MVVVLLCQRPPFLAVPLRLREILTTVTSSSSSVSEDKQSNCKSGAFKLLFCCNPDGPGWGLLGEASPPVSVEDEAEAVVDPAAVVAADDALGISFFTSVVSGAFLELLEGLISCWLDLFLSSLLEEVEVDEADAGDLGEAEEVPPPEDDNLLVTVTVCLITDPPWWW